MSVQSPAFLQGVAACQLAASVRHRRGTRHRRCQVALGGVWVAKAGHKVLAGTYIAQHGHGQW